MQAQRCLKGGLWGCWGCQPGLWIEAEVHPEECGPLLQQLQCKQQVSISGSCRVQPASRASRGPQVSEMQLKRARMGEVLPNFSCPPCAQSPDLDASPSHESSLHG